MDFLLDMLFFILPPSAFVYLLKKFDMLDFGNVYKDFKVENNIIGYGKAEGLYLVISGNHYIVAGKQISSKTAAIKEFIELANKNELTVKDFKILRNTNTKETKLEDIDKTELTEALEKVKSNEIISKEAIEKAILTEKNKKNSLKNNYNNQFKNQQNMKTQEVKQNISFEL
jgi:hypothetical protein